MEKGDKPKVKISKVKKDKVKKSKKPKEKKLKKARPVKRAKKTKKMIGADSKPMGAENPAEYKQPSRQMSGGGVSNFAGQMQIKAPEVKAKRKYTKKPKMDAPAPAPAPAPEPVKRGRGRPKGSKNTTKETGKMGEIMYLEPKKRKAELKEQQLQQQATPITKKELAEIVEPNLPNAEAPKEEKRPKERQKKAKMIVEEKPLASKKSKKSNNTFLSDPVDFFDVEEGEPFDQSGFLNSINQVQGTLGQKRTMITTKISKSSEQAKKEQERLNKLKEGGFISKDELFGIYDRAISRSVLDGIVEKVSMSGFQDANNLIATFNNSLTELINENIKDGPDMMHAYENEIDPKIDPSEIGDQVYPKYYDLPSAESSSSSTKKARGRPKGSKNQPENVI